MAWEAKGGSEQKESPMPWASVGNGDPEPPLEGAVRSEGVAPSPRGLWMGPRAFDGTGLGREAPIRPGLEACMTGPLRTL